MTRNQAPAGPAASQFLLASILLQTVSRLSPDCFQTVPTVSGLSRQHLPGPFCTGWRICPPGVLSRSQLPILCLPAIRKFEFEYAAGPADVIILRNFPLTFNPVTIFPQISSNESIFNIILLDPTFSSLKLPHFAPPSLSALRPFLGTLDSAFGCSRD